MNRKKRNKSRVTVYWRPHRQGGWDSRSPSPASTNNNNNNNYNYNYNQTKKKCGIFFLQNNEMKLIQCWQRLGGLSGSALATVKTINKNNHQTPVRGDRLISIFIAMRRGFDWIGRWEAANHRRINDRIHVSFPTSSSSSSSSPLHLDFLLYFCWNLLLLWNRAGESGRHVTSGQYPWRFVFFMAGGRRREGVWCNPKRLPIYIFLEFWTHPQRIWTPENDVMAYGFFPAAERCSERFLNSFLISVSIFPR